MNAICGVLVFVTAFWGKHYDFPVRKEIPPPFRDSATRAELIWVIKTISVDFTFEPSCEHIGETFQFVFPNAVPQHLPFSRTKAWYLTDVLAPYFRKQLLKDFSGTYYTLCYDETTNAPSYKEWQVAVRY